MDNGIKLYRCFSTPMKKRLLNILRRFPMTHSDLVKVTGLNAGYISVCLKEFKNAGIIELKQESHKMRIFMCWYFDTEFKIDTKKNVIIHKRIKRNPLPGHPDKFIASVFDLFKFNDPQFKKDIHFVIKNRNEMRAFSYLLYGDKEFPGDKKVLDDLIKAL